MQAVCSRETRSISVTYSLVRCLSALIVHAKKCLPSSLPCHLRTAQTGITRLPLTNQPTDQPTKETDLSKQKLAHQDGAHQTDRLQLQLRECLFPHVRTGGLLPVAGSRTFRPPFGFLFTLRFPAFFGNRPDGTAEYAGGRGISGGVCHFSAMVGVSSPYGELSTRGASAFPQTLPEEILPPTLLPPAFPFSVSLHFPTTPFLPFPTITTSTTIHQI